VAESSVFQAISGITDEDIAAAREMIGVPLRLEQFNREATLDTIRHYAHGMGDQNPLWRDEEYAARSPYGTVVAPPCFLYSVFAAGISPGFPALQTFFGSGRFTWHRPVLCGESIRAEAVMTGMTERSGARVARMIIQEGEVRYFGADGDLIAQYFSKALRIPRAASGEGLRYTPRDTYEYRKDELDAIEEATLSHTRRGATPRYWEEVNAGDTIPVLVKGPLDLNTIITYYSGALPYGYSPADTQWKLRHLARTSPEQIPNNRDAGWVAETTWPGMGHYQQHVARAVGMPGVYDNGWMRASWVSQALTDWAGDHGSLRSMEVKLVRPNLMNDTLWIRGTVMGKRVSGDGANVVDVELTGTNQLQDITSLGSATVALPSSALPSSAPASSAPASSVRNGS
jgi:acyl dehydratase